MFAFPLWKESRGLLYFMASRKCILYKECVCLVNYRHRVIFKGTKQYMYTVLDLNCKYNIPSIIPNIFLMRRLLKYIFRG